MARIFKVEYVEDPRRNQAFMVRGICEYDVLNPCWDDRPTDVVGQHWAGGPACQPCAEAAAQ